MGWMLEDQEKKYADEDRHARIGGCIGLALLLIIVPPVCWILATFTSGGQIVRTHLAAYYAYNGLPLGSLTPGLTGIAKQSCDLDRASPPPANLKEEQAKLTQKYDAQVKLYQQSYAQLQQLGQSVSYYQDPGKIPGTLASAKLISCR